jgi:galactose mutarotase-like enzyme
MTACQITEQTLEQSIRALRLENDLLSTTILLDKGADIYQLIYKPQNLDVLWKSPWGLIDPTRHLYSASDSATAWLESYAGGWQELFPNGGDAAHYKGIELNFHGEASMIPWRYDIVEASGDAAEIRLYARLLRSPFLIERFMRVEAGSPMLTIRGRITNEGGEDMDYMWSHHPAFGAPFLSDQCVVDVGTNSVLVDDVYAGFANPLKLDAEYTWPLAEGVDLSQVPGTDTPRDMLAYFKDFDEAWFSVTNREMGFGVGYVWDKEAFPYAWYWQELHASPGFPFYKGCYVMAIEPASSIPGQGLVNVIEKTGTHRSLAPGQSTEATLRAVFYDSNIGVQSIQQDGTVILK